MRFQRGAAKASAFKGAEIPNTEFHLGQQVGHKLFGDGVVLNYEGQGPQARIQINFKQVGTKWLVVSYAKLEAI